MFPLILDAVANHDRVFRGLDGLGGASARVPYAPMDVRETESGFEVSLDVPGIAKKDIKVTLEGAALTVEGERQAPDGPARPNRWYGKFRRELEFSGDVDAAGVTASLADGVLVVFVPKAEAARARRIEVR